METKITKEKLFNANFILLSIASLLMFVGFYLVMPICAKYVIERFGADPSTAGAVVASYIITSLLTRPFSGYLVDRFDRRKFYLIVYTIFAVLLLGYIFSTSIWGVVITRVLLGIFFSLVTTSASTISIDVVPSSRRGEGIGYYGAIIVFAMATGPMVGLYMLELFSYTTLFITASASCFVGVFIASFVKTKSRPVVVREPISLDRFLLRDALSIAIVVGLSYFLYGTLGAYVALYLGESGLSVSSGNFFLFFAVGILASRIVSGWALKRGLTDLMVRLGLGIIIASALLFALGLNSITFPIASTMLGVGFGFSTPSIQSMIVSLVPSHRRGTANSTYFIALDLGSGLGMLAGGAIAERWNYQMLYVFGVSLVIVALLFYLLYARSDYASRMKNVAPELDVESSDKGTSGSEEGRLIEQESI